MMTSKLDSFIESIRAVLPSLKLMGKTLEACGLECDESSNNPGAGFFFAQGDKHLRLAVIASLFGEIVAQCSISRGEFADVTLTANSKKDGKLVWSIIFSGSRDHDIAELEKSLRKLVPDIPIESDIRGPVRLNPGNLYPKDDATAIEVVRMMVAAFKKDGKMQTSPVPPTTIPRLP